MTGWTIPPTAVFDGDFDGAGAWRRDSFPDAEAWTCRLRPETLREIAASLDRIRSRGKSLASLDPGDFDLPSFSLDVRQIARELVDGRGFVVIEGLPAGHYTSEETTMLYWGLGSRFGHTLAQNVKGDRVYSVRDEGQRIERDYGTVGVRFSKTRRGLDFHTDSAPALMGDTPDIVGLLALKAAKSGGATKLVSAQTAHNILRRERLELLVRLYRPYHFDRRAELRDGEEPTLYAPVFTHAASLAVRYFRFYIPKGHELRGAPLAPVDIEALDYLDDVMNRAEMAVTFDMKPGEIQLVNNRRVLHSRTPYDDHPEPERRRHLVRLWLKAD